MAQITPLSLFVINKSKLRRLILGIKARQLSLNLKHGESYVSKIEDTEQVNTYPPSEWANLANELDCEIHDLLPENQTTSTGELVDKIILNFHNEKDVREVILALIENGFFDTSKTITDTSKHLFIDEHTQIAILSTVMNQMPEERILKQHLDGFTKGNY